MTIDLTPANPPQPNYHLSTVNIFIQSVSGGSCLFSSRVVVGLTPAENFVWDFVVGRYETSGFAMSSDEPDWRSVLINRLQERNRREVVNFRGVVTNSKHSAGS